MNFAYLLYFKLYSWNRQSWYKPSSSQFSITSFVQNNELNTLIKKINQHYVSYESTEIWHLDFLKNLFSKIRYYKTLDLFQSEEDYQMVLKDLSKHIAHLKSLAEHGKKQIYGQKEDHAQLKLYMNFIDTSPSIIFIKTPDFSMVYNQFLKPNYIRTRDEEICRYTEQWLRNTSPNQRS